MTKSEIEARLVNLIEEVAALEDEIYWINNEIEELEEQLEIAEE